ncbi:MAG: thioredoxin family protein [Sedimentisphaerales bacterium]|jgi:thioredoxin 1|nr:thioredoxin family protein [Sedimentisphaerales bacterium]
MNMNKMARTLIVGGIVVAITAILVFKNAGHRPQGPVQIRPSGSGLPRLVDLGSDTCIPCKLMAPILEQLRKEYQGRLEVEFIDVGRHPQAATTYGISVIPTQIFFDPNGKELFRHEGFLSKEDILAKWKELGIDLQASQASFERLEPAMRDDRPKDRICFMCDGDVNDRAAVAIQTEKGLVRLCGLHCYFIMYSCPTEDKTGIEDRVTVADWADGGQVQLRKATFLYGHQEDTGRPWIKAFATKQVA